MENNKKIQKNKNTDELDVMVTETSHDSETMKKTRAVPNISPPASPEKSVPLDKTMVNTPISSPEKKIEPSPKSADKKTATSATTRQRPVRPAREIKKDNPAKTHIPNKLVEEERKNGGLLFGIAKALIYIIAVITISGILSYFGIIYANDIFAFVKEEKIAEIEIDENTTVSELADLLHSAELIEHPGVFKFYTWYRHRNNEQPIEFKPGVYSVSSQLNYDMMLSAFKKKSNGRTIVTLTFKEGLTVDETIKIFTDAGVGTREGFIEAINNYEYDYRFVKELDNWQDIPGRKYRLEGYLYPDTYDFYTDSDESFIISKLLSNFNQKFEEEYYDRCAALGYSVDDIINLASIIEKEGYLQEDLEVISSVFHNRLDRWENPYLQSDATIQYSFAQRKKEITLDDLEIDSPYNTYLYKGLPPSAIANPGLESILAALYPASTDYYYFVTRINGAAVFSRTLGEHNNAKLKIKNESATRALALPEQSDEVLAETDNIIG